MIAPMPPMSAEGTAPIKAANRPARNWPSEPVVPVNRALTAITRPSMSLGVRVCTREWRMTTLTASHNRHRHGGEELHQPDEPEIERVAGHVVDLPADRDPQHLVGGRGGDARAPEIRKRCVRHQGRKRCGSGIEHG
jgi:hypothetical protein